MAEPPPPRNVVLEIKKYPNRRLYDATRSCHVTLGQLYDLVASGQTVVVRDSKSGEDITNQVLLQALIERDPLKIGTVPSSLIHLMIRLNNQMLASWFDLYVRHMTDAYRAAQGGMPAWWRAWPASGMGWSPGPGSRAAGPGSPAPPSPLSWMTGFLKPEDTPAGHEADVADPFDEPEDEGEFGGDRPGPTHEELESLQRQIAALAAEITRLKGE